MSSFSLLSLWGAVKPNVFIRLTPSLRVTARILGAFDAVFLLVLLFVRSFVFFVAMIVAFPNEVVVVFLKSATQHTLLCIVSVLSSTQARVSQLTRKQMAVVLAHGHKGGQFRHGHIGIRCITAEA